VKVGIEEDVQLTDGSVGVLDDLQEEKREVRR